MIAVRRAAQVITVPVTDNEAAAIDRIEALDADPAMIAEPEVVPVEPAALKAIEVAVIDALDPIAFHGMPGLRAGGGGATQHRESEGAGHQGLQHLLSPFDGALFVCLARLRRSPSLGATMEGAL